MPIAAQEQSVVVVQGAEASALHVAAPLSPSVQAEEAEEPSAPCDVRSNDAGVVIDEANNHYRAGEFAKALACAQLAVDLTPQAVAAHHLEAAALTGLARYQEAEVAFAMALALDPDDPETLADVADFFINILPPTRRETIEVGLAYARRGGRRALSRRRYDPQLQGRLLLLEAEALNDLGEPGLALPRVLEAMERAPGLLGAEHERAVSLFRLLRFADSEAAFLQVLSTSPEDAYAHYHLGLIYERRGKFADAEAHFLRARRLAPGEFSAPILLSQDEFRAEVALAISELPLASAKLVSSVSLELDDLPSNDDLSASEPPFSPTILGLFRGLPAGVEPELGVAAPPRSIVLYRKNLGRAVRSRTELNEQIRHTLRHEIGHLQGYNEAELRRRGLE